MKPVHFRALDLNLLRVLDVLIEERSVTRAGDRLGLTQSAVSHALNRLRHALDDELLVRGQDGMEPTARALEIGPRLRSGLNQLQAGLVSAAFEPEATERQFVLACSDYATAAILPGLMARLRTQAPRASLRVQSGGVGVAEALQSGRVDLAIGSFAHVPERYACDVLFEETMMWAVGADNPANRGPLTLDGLARLPHLIIALTGPDIGAIDGVVQDHGLEWRVMRDDADVLLPALAARGLTRWVALTVPHVLAAARIVAHTDMAALMPRRLAVPHVDRYHLRLFEPPYASPAYSMMAVWDRGHGEQPAMAWFRGLLLDTALEIAAGSARPRFTVYG